MGISKANVLALGSLPPHVMSEPYYDFFQFLDSESTLLLKVPIIERSQLLEQFYQVLKEYYTKKEFENKKDSIKKSYDYLLKKLHSISFLRDDEQFVSEIKLDKLREFYSLIKHIKKSDERKIRWAIFNLFSSGKRSISLKELKTSLAEFKISNLERMINKIIQQASVDGLNIILKNEMITIDHKITDENVVHHLVEHVEYVSRRSRGELEQQILDLLDEGSYSNQEIAEICDADKSMVSKTMNQLEKVDKTIVYSSGGPRGIRYYTTNCENCPWGFERQECKKNATEYISNHLLREFDMKLP